MHLLRLKVQLSPQVHLPCRWRERGRKRERERGRGGGRERGRERGEERGEEEVSAGGLEGRTGEWGVE